MGDTRDPNRDQPMPKPGGVNVQQVLINAIREREQYGVAKYGRPLETHNGRDALTDAWEEALDLLSYLTQARLERGDSMPGVEYEAGPAGRHPAHAVQVPASAYRIREADTVALNFVQDLVEGDWPLQQAATRWLEEHRPTTCRSCMHPRHGDRPSVCGATGGGAPCQCVNDLPPEFDLRTCQECGHPTHPAVLGPCGSQVLDGLCQCRGPKHRPRPEDVARDVEGEWQNGHCTMNTAGICDCKRTRPGCVENTPPGPHLQCG